MSKSFHINTILAQAGIKSDEATGALVTPIHFSTTYQHPEFGQSTGFDYTRTKTQLVARQRKFWQLLNQPSMLWRLVQVCLRLC